MSTKILGAGTYNTKERAPTPASGPRGTGPCKLPVSGAEHLCPPRLL